MTHNLFETAIREGIPFAINMADGRQYEVREKDRIFLGKTHVVLVDEQVIPHVLPLLTMTGLTDLPAKEESQRT